MFLETEVVRNLYFSKREQEVLQEAVSIVDNLHSILAELEGFAVSERHGDFTAYDLDEVLSVLMGMSEKLSLKIMCD